MQELEKILEEIKILIEKHKNEAYVLVAKEPLTQCYTETDIEQTKVHELAVVRDIIRKHMSGKDTDVSTNDGWIPVERELPPNAKYKGAFCPKYQVMTKYGVTEGWYNPDCESWYVLVWFIRHSYFGDIDFERGDNPKVLRLSNAVNNVQHILTAWKPIEPYRPEREGEGKD